MERLITSEESVIVKRRIEEVFDLLWSAPAWSSSVIAVVDESPPGAPLSSSWRYKINCTTTSMWLRYRVVAKEPPRRLAFTLRPLGLIHLGQRAEGEYILTPTADGSVMLASRCVIRLSRLNPFYWTVRGSKWRARQRRSLHTFGAWVESYDGTIPVPIETTTSQAIGNARNARPRRIRNVVVVVVAATVLSWALYAWLFFYATVIVLALFALDSFASNRDETIPVASD